MGLLIFIYSRTLLKLTLGEGKLAQRACEPYSGPLRQDNNVSSLRG